MHATRRALLQSTLAITATAALPAAFARNAPSVTDWGARCDGRTDDTVAFQRALNERVPVLRVPAGRCLLSPGIKFGADGQRLVGAGAGKTVLVLRRGLANDDFVGAAGWDRCEVSDLSFDGSELRQGKPNTSLLNFSGVSGARVRNVGFAGFDRFALGMNFVTDFEVSNCTFQRSRAANTHNQAIVVSSASGSSARGRVRGCKSLNSGFAFDVNGLTIDNCEVSGWRFGGGITLEQSRTSRGVRIVNNDIHDGTGFDVNNAALSGIECWARDSLISGNRVYRCGGAGLDAGGQNSVVENNEFFDNNVNPGQFAGIVARYPNAQYNANGTLFRNNRSYNTRRGKQHYGYIEESPQLSGIVLDGNDFNGNAKGPALIQSRSTRMRA